MTPKQQRFVQEYLLDLNAAAAARRAGYSAHTADRIGHENLRKPEISAAIAAAQADVARRNAVSADRVLQELAAVAFSDLGELVEFGADGIRFRPAGQVSEQARRAVSAIKIKRDLGGEDRPPSETVEFKLWSKVDALRQLAQHLGLLKDRLDVHVQGPPFKVYLGFSPDEALCPPSPPETKSSPSDGPTGPRARRSN